jgi:hypothetical protein
MSAVSHSTVTRALRRAATAPGIRWLEPGSPSAIARAGLLLTATGVISAATARYAVDGSADIVFAYGSLLYLLLVVVAASRRQLQAAPLIAFGAFAAMYLSAIVGDRTNDLGLSLYVIAAGAAYLATPVVFRPLTVAAFALWTPAFRLFGPTPFGDRYPGWVAAATILALFFLVAVLIAREAVPEDERLRRIGLGLLAVAIVARVSERHSVVASLGVAPDELWALFAVAVLPIVAVVRLRSTTRDALATGVALGAYLLVGLALIFGKPYHVDSVVAVHRATELFLAGADPYRDLNLVDALVRVGLDPSLATRLEDGSLLTSYSYPALSFLVPAPFLALGLGDVRLLYLAEVLLFGLILIRAVRVPWRPLVAAAIVGNAVIVRQNVLAGVDPLWALFTLGAFLTVRRRWWSPVLLGLAVATRQPAWFFVPFYLVVVWRRDGRSEAVRRTGILAVAALLPNLPFLVWSPAAFLGGVLSPTFAPLEPYGVGLIRFGMDGQLPLFTRGAYGVLSVGVLVVLLVVLWRAWRRLPGAAVVFPSVVLWFAWRSLQNYFGFAALFALHSDDAFADVAATGPATPPAAGPS